jgi:hypothetical protein
MPAARTVVVAAVLLTTGLVAGCSSKGTVATPSTTASGGATTVPAAGVVNPNAPEVHEAGDIPDTAVFVPYSPPDKSYTVKYPEGWSRTGDGDQVSFTDKFNAIDVAVLSGPAAPTIDSVTSVDLPAIAAKAGNFKAGKVSKVSRKSGDAIVALYQIDSAPNAVTGKTIRVAVERYEFWRGGRSVVLTLIGAVGADNVDPWRIVTDSFSWPA